MRRHFQQSSPCSLQTRILANLEHDADRRSIAFLDAEGQFTWLSRGEFHGRARRAAGALAELGLGAGQVGVVAAVDPEACATAVMGMLILGAQPLLVAPPLIQGINSSLMHVLVDVVHRTKPKLVLLPQQMKDLAHGLQQAHAGVQVELGFGRILQGEDWAASEATPASDDVAALQLTSGTTGFPRIAVWEQQQVLDSLDAMAQGMDLNADDVYLNWTPLYHDMGLVNNFLLCQVFGIPLALMSPLDVVRHPTLWLKGLHDTSATTTWSPNFGYALAAQRIKDDELVGLRLDRVRGFWNAAERVHYETLQRFHQRFERCGVQWRALKANFGCVESIGGVTFTDPAGPLIKERVHLPTLQEQGLAIPPPTSNTPEPWEWIVGCGRAVPGLKLQVFDPDGQRLPDGQVGDVGLHTTAHFREYLDQPGETAQAIRAGVVFSGDLGYMRGEEFFWVGRRSERLNIQGKKIDPSEFEPVLFAVDGLRKGCFVVFGIDDEQSGTQVPVLISEVEQDSSQTWPSIASAIQSGVATQLGVSLGELILVAKGTLTKTSSGKRRHRYFRQLYLSDGLRALFRVGPRSPR